MSVTVFRGTQRAYWGDGHVEGDDDLVFWLIAHDFGSDPVSLTATGPRFVPSVFSEQGLLAAAVALGLDFEGGDQWLDVPLGAVDGENAPDVLVAKHYGPGPHPSGSPQSDHGRPGLASTLSPSNRSPENRSEDEVYTGEGVVTAEEWEARKQATTLPVREWTVPKDVVNAARKRPNEVELWLKSGLNITFRFPDDPGITADQGRAWWVEQLDAVEQVYASKRGRVLFDALGTMGGDTAVSRWSLEFSDLSERFASTTGQKRNTAGLHSLTVIGHQDPPVFSSRVEVDYYGFILNPEGRLVSALVPRPSAGLQHTIIHEMAHSLDAHTFVAGPLGEVYYSALAFDDPDTWGQGGPPKFQPARPDTVPDLDVVLSQLHGAALWRDSLPKGQRQAWVYPIITTVSSHPTNQAREFFAETVRYWATKPAHLKALVRATNTRRHKQWEDTQMPWNAPRPPPIPIPERALIDWVENALRTHLPDDYPIPVTKRDDPIPDDGPDLVTLALAWGYWPEGLSPEELESILRRSKAADLVVEDHPIGLWLKGYRDEKEGENNETESAVIGKSLGPAYGRRLVRRAQLVRRLKQARSYPTPVKGGTGKQHRTRRRRWL